jgi:hypothetical protein
LDLLRQRGQLVVLCGGVPGQQVQVTQALEHGLQRLGPDGVEELLDVFA